MEVVVSRVLLFLFLLLTSCSGSSCYRSTPLLAPPETASRPWEGALLATGQVEAVGALGSGIGTAWLVATKGSAAYWVTAGHVCSPGAMYTIAHDGEDHPAASLAFSDEPDLCLLMSFGAVNAAPLSLSTVPAEVGDELCYTGNHAGVMAIGIRPIFCGKAAGSSEGRLFLSAPGYPGASGSAVVNADGKVVGVMVATLRAWPEVLFLVPLEDLTAFLSTNLK